MSVSPETAPEDLDQSGTAAAPGSDHAPEGVTDAAPPGTGADEAQSDVETAEPGRLDGGPR